MKGLAGATNTCQSRLLARRTTLETLFHRRKGQIDMAEPRYLKNAWAKKDADGVYWLFIQSGDLQAMFNLYEPSDAEQDEDSAIQRTLDAWLAEQDSTNGNEN